MLSESSHSMAATKKPETKVSLSSNLFSFASIKQCSKEAKALNAVVDVGVALKRRLE